MKKISSLLILVLWGCSHPSPEEMASLAAKGYYDHLVSGEYEYFFEGMDQSEMMNEVQYRSQLIDNYRQFKAEQDSAHGGIREVRIVRASTDSVQKFTNVFLMLCFGDSTNEEIVVPMVERDGRWYMR